MWIERGTITEDGYPRGSIRYEKGKFLQIFNLHLLDRDNPLQEGMLLIRECHVSFATCILSPFKGRAVGMQTHLRK